MMPCKAYLCVDAGGTFFKYTVFDEAGNQCIPVSEAPVNSNGSKEEILAVYRQIIEQVSGDYIICGMGISTPGPFDYVACASQMQHKFKSLYQVDMRKELGRFLPEGCKVMFMSDSNAFLCGAYDGPESVLGVTLGTGLGFSVVVDGKLITNPLGGPAEVIYNKMIDGQIAEYYVSGKGISAYYAELSGKEGFTAREVAELAFAGDEQAKAVYEKMGTVLGKAVSEYVEKYHAKKLIMGGQIAKSATLFEDSVQKAIAENVHCALEILTAPNAGNTALVGVYRALRNM